MNRRNFITALGAVATGKLRRLRDEDGDFGLPDPGLGTATPTITTTRYPYIKTSQTTESRCYGRLLNPVLESLSTARTASTSIAARRRAAFSQRPTQAWLRTSFSIRPILPDCSRRPTTSIGFL